MAHSYTRDLVSQSSRVLTHVWKQHITTQELGQRLGFDSIDTYIARRQLRWLGHVSRMDYETRLPRRMLSSW
eukprot:2021522-Prymnesium_polylepis.1